MGERMWGLSAIMESRAQGVAPIPWGRSAVHSIISDIIRQT